MQFFVSARKPKLYLFFLWLYHSLHTLSVPHPTHVTSTCSFVHRRCPCVAAAEGTDRRPALHPWAPGSLAGAFVHPRRWTVLEEAADPAFVLQDLSALRAHPPVWTNREGLENQNIACYINLCLLKVSAIVISMPKKKVVVILKGRKERSKSRACFCAVFACLLNQ